MWQDYYCLTNKQGEGPVEGGRGVSPSHCAMFCVSSLPGIYLILGFMFVPVFVCVCVFMYTSPQFDSVIP